MDIFDSTCNCFQKIEEEPIHTDEGADPFSGTYSEGLERELEDAHPHVSSMFARDNFICCFKLAVLRTFKIWRF